MKVNLEGLIDSIDFRYCMKPSIFLKGNEMSEWRLNDLVYVFLKPDFARLVYHIGLGLLPHHYPMECFSHLHFFTDCQICRLQFCYLKWGVYFAQNALLKMSGLL